MASTPQLKHCNGPDGCDGYHATLTECKIRDKNRRARGRREAAESKKAAATVTIPAQEPEPVPVQEVVLPIIPEIPSFNPFDSPDLLSVPDDVILKMRNIVKLADEVNQSLGSGYDESTYQKALTIEFLLLRITAETERDIPIMHKGFHVANKRIDILLKTYLESILELKATTKDGLKDVERVQLKRYMSLTGTKYGFLINFVQTVSMESHIHAECYTIIDNKFCKIDLDTKVVSEVTI